MKRKDLLAADYWIENTNRIYNEKLHISTPVIDAYLAGFEKAREMAQAECTRFIEYEMPEVIDIETRIGELGEEKAN